MMQEKQKRLTNHPVKIDWFADPDMPKDWEAVQYQGRFNRDAMIGVAAGLVKLPSDVGNLFGFDWAKNYEDAVVNARNFLQSKQLNDDRANAMTMLQQGKSLKDVVNKYPEAAAQYGIENFSIPVGGSIRAGTKAYKSTLPYVMQLGRHGHPEYALGAAYLAASPTTGAINSLYQDYNENKGK